MRDAWAGATSTNEHVEQGALGSSAALSITRSLDAQFVAWAYNEKEDDGILPMMTESKQEVCRYRVVMLDGEADIYTWSTRQAPR